MNKSSVLLTSSVIFLCVSQWGSSIWLANNIKSKDQSSITNIAPNDNSVSAPPTNAEGINVERLDVTVEGIVRQQVQLALEKYSQHLVAIQTVEYKRKVEPEKKTIANVNAQDSLSDTETNNEQSDESQQEFIAAMDIVSAAVLNYEWDESTSSQIMSYRDKLTDKQRNEIVSEYVKAFEDGLVDPGVNPPF
jgi:hypothetical protein